MGGGTGEVCPTTLSAGRDAASPQTVLEVCQKLPQAVVGTVVTALVAGVVLVLVKLLNGKLQRRLPLPIPGELLTLIGATGISYGVGLQHRFGVDVVGNIPAGCGPGGQGGLGGQGQLFPLASLPSLIGWYPQWPPSSSCS